MVHLTFIGGDKEENEKIHKKMKKIHIHEIIYNFTVIVREMGKNEK